MNDALIKASLAVAVPLWVEDLKLMPWSYIQRRAKECSNVVAEKGDIILYRSGKKGASAEAFNRLAEGVACLSFVPGGVTVFGQHWENELVEELV